MKNTASDLAGLPYDPLSMASLQLWKQENQEDNRPRIERLLRNLPLAMEEELTPRQRQIMPRSWASTRPPFPGPWPAAPGSCTAACGTVCKKTYIFPGKALTFPGKTL